MSYRSPFILSSGSYYTTSTYRCRVPFRVKGNNDGGRTQPKHTNCKSCPMLNPGSANVSTVPSEISGDAWITIAQDGALVSRMPIAIDAGWSVGFLGDCKVPSRFWSVSFRSGFL